MKRHLRRILLCLALGVVTTVGVAWGWLATRPHLRVDLPRGDPPSFVARILEDVGERNRPGWSEGGHYRSTGYQVFEWKDVESGVVRESMTYASAGLPLKAFEGVWMTSAKPPLHRAVGAIATSFVWRSGFGSFVPVRPILPGFLIDTVFYAAIWFALLSGFSTTRTFIRRRRGRCPACGYDLRGATYATCPECGAAAKPEGGAEGAGA